MGSFGWCNEHGSFALSDQVVAMAVPGRERYLHTRLGHLTYVNPTNRGVVTGEVIRAYKFTGKQDLRGVPRHSRQLRARLP